MKTQESIGKLLDRAERQRDAIHIAVFPAVASCELLPGQHVGFDAETQRAIPLKPLVGIVDPFLLGPVLPGERFWLLLYPNTIESLRHDWAHPAFPRIWPGEASPPPDDDVAGARAEIEAIASDMGSDGSDDPELMKYYGPVRPMTYARLMAAAEDWLAEGDYHTEKGRESWRSNFPYERFWQLYETVTGQRVTGEKAANFFSCMC